MLKRVSRLKPKILNENIKQSLDTILLTLTESHLKIISFRVECCEIAQLFLPLSENCHKR